MAAIVGVIRTDGAPVDVELTNGMLETLQHRSPDGRGLWHQDNAAMGFGRHHTTIEALSEVQPLVSDDGSLVVVADARIDNRSDLESALSCTVKQDFDGSDSSFILAAYKHWGSDCTKRLVGDFAFAVWDRRRGTLFCARDTMGVRSFYFFHNHNLFAFATEVKALLGLPCVSGAIDEEHFANFLVGDLSDERRTFYSGIQTLPPRQNLLFRNGTCSFETYWHWDAKTELRLGSDSEYAEAFLETFSQAIKARLRSTSRVGCFLSGGLDSSSICCVAREILVDQGVSNLPTFSAIFPNLPEESLQQIDERYYVSEVLGNGAFEPHFIEADKLNPIDGIDQVLARIDGPHAGYNMYLHQAIYECSRKNGVDVILDGIDGDTTVSHGNERITELAKTLRIWRLLWQARALARRSPNKKLTTRGVLTQLALIPLNLKRSDPPPLTRGLAADVRYLRPEFADRWDMRRRIRELALERDPFATARATHAETFVAPHYPILLDLADKVAAFSGVEVRYPFFDRRLMEFCLSLPSKQKLNDGWSRSILRNAMDGILPETLRWRPDKSSLSPNFERGMRQRSKDMLTELVGEKRASRAADFFDLDEFSSLRDGGNNADWTLIFSGIAAVKWLSSHEREPAGKTWI